MAFALFACSSGGGGGSLAALGIDDGASGGRAKSANVSAEKGASIELETGALVEIPAGAVAKDVRVSLERPSDGKALELLDRLPKAEERIASAPYVLTPHGTKFQSDVTVKLPLSKKDAQSVSVAWLEDEDDETWKVLSAAEIEGDKAAVKLKHFSVLLLIEDTSGLGQLDAGTGSDDEDAGDVEDGASAEERDAEGPDEADTSTMAESDAGSSEEAGTAEMDAGEDPLDASSGGEDASGPADADPGSDARPLPDGSVSVDGSVTATSLLARLTECDLILEQGYLPEPTLTDPVSHCAYHCVLAGECLDVQGFYCLNGDTSYSAATAACMNDCGPTFFVCPDQTQGYFYCDGNLDCPGGEDEAGCDPAYFECQAGNRLPSYRRCDHVPDCQSGEDEIGCPWHLCDGDIALPPDYVCDGYLDCSDGTDEPASCASVNCSITTL